MKNIRIKPIGTAVQKAADKWLKTSLKISENYPHDMQSLIKCAYADAKDLYTVGALIKQGEGKKAFRLADSLDTIIRDQIPSSAWQLMETYVGGGNFRR